jgi:hypothetical protein
VIVALGAAERDSEKSLRGVLDGVFEPLLAAEHLVIADKESGRAQRRGIFGCQLVTREHLDNHAIVAFVRVQRFDDPIAPTPDVPLTVAHLLAIGPAGPIAVAPDIHPMPAPALAVARIGEQTIDDLFIRIRERSSSKARCSSGVGESPMRSRYTRRKSTAFDAIGRGCSPRRPCSSAMKASMGVRTQSSCSTLELPAGDAVERLPAIRSEKLPPFVAQLREL